MPDKNTEKQKTKTSRDRPIIVALIGAGGAIVAAVIAVAFTHGTSTSSSSPDIPVSPTPSHSTSAVVSPTSTAKSGTSGSGQLQGLATVQSALLQASDLGTGWTRTQVPTGSGSATCPNVSQHVSDDASVAYSDGNNATVIEEVVKTSSASSVVSEYANSANGCSYTKGDESGLTTTFTYQADDTAHGYGAASEVFTIGGTNMPGETPTIAGYSAVIRSGNEVALIGIAVGLYSEPSESAVLNKILPAAARRLG
jgi:hypothetical protein